MKTESFRALKLFKALSNGTRYRIIEVLYTQKYDVTELSAILQKNPTNISQHLKILRDLDIVGYYTSANSVIYYLKNQKIYDIIIEVENYFTRAENPKSTAESSNIL